MDQESKRCRRLGTHERHTGARDRFLLIHLSLTLVSVTVLVLFDSLDLRLLFFLTFIGYLLSLEVTAPLRGLPPWRSRLRLVTAAWTLAYALLVGRYLLGTVISL